MGIAELIHDKREEILRIAAKHGAQRIRVFGSVVRGEAGPQSDVDFLVEVGARHSPFFPGGLVMDLEALLGRRVDVVEPDGLYPPLKAAVLQEAVPV
jgi:predicted nucleotidyltransferase